MTSVATATSLMRNKVPKVTVEFWLIKLLAVTVGETAADYMNLHLGLGLSTTSWILGAILAVMLVLQFAQRNFGADAEIIHHVVRDQRCRRTARQR